jgi:hypothetical protein
MTNRQNDSLTWAYRRSVEQIAGDLRALADRVERNANPSSRSRIPYLGRAMDIQADVMNVLPNLKLDLLFERAHDCETLMEKDA